MKKLVTFFASIVLAVSAAVAQTDDSFVVATGDAKAGSTYSQMFNEFEQQCKKHNLSEQQSTGSVKNVDLLTSNKVNGAFVQSDLLFFTRMTDPSKVSNIKTIASMYPEELHFIARGDVKKEGGFMGIGASKVTFNTINDLQGRVVGAVGGSVLSGHVVSAKSGLNFQMLEFPSTNDMMTALLAGQIDSVLVVGGAPHSTVAALDRRFKLLTVPKDVSVKVADVYSPAKLSYSNLGQSGVDGLATQSLFVTRSYKSPAMNKKIGEVRKCFYDAVLTLQEARKTHPKWQLVDIEDKGKWDFYLIK